jgi:hypothetical protein
MALSGLAPQRAAAAARQQARGRPLTAPQVLPAPIKGWNTRDAYEAMDPQDAITLDNWQPDYGGLRLREGAQLYLTVGDTTKPVTTLAVWASGGSSNLLGATQDKIWGVDQNSQLGSGFTSGWWQTAMFNHRLFWVNGSDPPQSYNGTALAAAGFVKDPTSTYTLNPNNLIGVQVVHNRLFFWTNFEAGFWYGDVFAITGNLNYFAFEMLVADAAFLVNVQNLTYDGGVGIQAYTIFTLSTGEVLVYAGTDPSDPSNWALVGIYTTPAPISQRAICRYGGDSYLITSSDYTKLSQLMIALKLGTVPPRSKAAGACQDAVSQGRGQTGWQAIYWGFGRRLIMNVPLVALDTSGNRTFEQHVYHTGLDAWCRYTSLPSHCWAVWNDNLYFGTHNGKVVQFGVQGGDELVSGTITNIVSFGQQAWNLFGTPTQKRVAAIRPIMRSAQTVQYQFGLGYDYGPPNMTISAMHVGEPTPWNTTPWNSVPWERDAETDTIWYVAAGDGTAISVAVQSTTISPQPLIWVRTDLRIEPGAAL